MTTSISRRGASAALRFPKFQTFFNMKKHYVYSALIALFISASSIATYHFFNNENQTFKIEHINSTPASRAVYSVDDSGNFVPLDFTKTADKVMEAVVHIKSTQTRVNASRQVPQAGSPFPFFNDPLFEDFFGNRFKFENQSPRNPGRKPEMRMGTGSGVIISPNGYIVTNNHVIDNADDVEVTLHDNRNYKATVIGTDPSTDLALLQIKEENLPSLPFVDSDQVKVGEWVMAVGNPFNLNSTVTAGIVSAKGRNINILKEKFAVESFIQTDAAINPGNSGGALVNLEGGLVGINTAIASPTGSYSGYGFAVPTRIVSKVVDDLRKYGVVQRGVLGVMIRSVDGNLKKDKSLSTIDGVYVDSLLENSAAGKAGVQKGDVILSIDGHRTNTSPALQEIIARRRPGDKIELLIDRKGKEKKIEVTLNNRSGGTDLVKKEHKEIITILGAEFEDLEDSEIDKLNIEGGVRVKEIYRGKLMRETQMKNGFIITHVNGRKIKSVKDLANALENKKGGVMIEGIYEDLPGSYYYAFGI